MRITIDAHNDTLMKAIHEETWKHQTSLNKASDFDIDALKMKAGGLDAGFFAAFTDDLGTADRCNAYLAAMCAALLRTTSEANSILKKALCLKEAQQWLKQGHCVAFQTIEGGYGISEENAQRLLMQYADLGVKAITLVWNHANALGVGAKQITAGGESAQYGLTPLGRKVITQMEALGILVDVSHMDEATFWDTLGFAKQPLIASHSGAAAIHPHVRNLTDDQLKAIAQNGGVAHAVLCTGFLGASGANTEVLLRHIRHMVDVAGEDHVGIGSDFDGAEMPEDLPDASHFYKIADGLRAIGYSERTIEKIMGGNTIRVLKKAEKQLQTPLMQPSINNGKISASLTTPPLGHTHTLWLNGRTFPALWDAATMEISAQVDEACTEKFYFASFASEAPLWRITGILEA